MEDKVVRAHVYIQGSVQGIGYRYWTRGQARKLRLTGWARNLSDGRVEAVFDGPQKSVEEMIKRCRKGPMFAGIKHIDIIWEETKGEFKDFEIIK